LTTGLSSRADEIAKLDGKTPEEAQAKVKEIDEESGPTLPPLDDNGQGSNDKNPPTSPTPPTPNPENSLWQIAATVKLREPGIQALIDLYFDVYTKITKEIITASAAGQIQRPDSWSVLIMSSKSWAWTWISGSKLRSRNTITMGPLSLSRTSGN
jgi:hypothetical protein